MLHHEKLRFTRGQGPVLPLPLPRGKHCLLASVEIPVRVRCNGYDIAEAKNTFCVGLVADDAQRPGVGVQRLGLGSSPMRPTPVGVAGLT